MSQRSKRRFEGRGGAWVPILLLASLAVAAWVGAGPPPAPDTPVLEYTEVAVKLPDDTLEQWGTHPDMRVMGIEKEPSSDVLCSSERVERMGAFVVGHGVGELFVDAVNWEATPSSARAGIASFFSKCHHNGEPLIVLAGPGGTLLAVYEPEGGLSPRSR